MNDDSRWNIRPTPPAWLRGISSWLWGLPAVGSILILMGIMQGSGLPAWFNWAGAGYGFGLSTVMLIGFLTGRGDVK